MSEEFGSDFISITDDEGNNFELERINSIEFEGETYSLFLPADMEEDDPDYGFIILKDIEENGEVLFGSVDDEDELQRVYERFMELLFEDEDDCGEDGCGCGHDHSAHVHGEDECGCGHDHGAHIHDDDDCCCGHCHE